MTAPGLDSILERAARDPRRIVFSEPEDPRVRAAAARVAREAVARPVMLGPPPPGGGPGGVDWIDPGDGAATEPMRETLRELLGDRLSEAELAPLLSDSLYLAAAAVRAGLADGTVGGAVRSTADVLRAALRVIRPADGVSLVSSSFLTELARPTAAGDRVLAYADCGLVPDPDPGQLAEIALQTAGQLQLLLGVEPRVAFLSFSTKGSAEHPRIEKVRAAVAALRERGAPGGTR